MRWLLLSLLIMQVATCGQRGPLTLPDQSATAIRIATDSAPT